MLELRSSSILKCITIECGSIRRWATKALNSLSRNIIQNLQVQCAAKPDHLIVSLANTNKFLSMRADSFQLYLQEDGLDTIIKLRQQRRQTQSRSRELYRRCVKTLIQAGPVELTDKTFSIDTGMPLEIIPIKNPYLIKPNEWVELRVLFNHKPLANALVRYWTRPFAKGRQLPDTKPEGLTQERQRSDVQGRVRFRLKAGQNMISLVHMVPAADSKEADWQSYWGSLTFGCR